MTASSISIHLQRFVPTPYTIHADWQSAPTALKTSSTQQILELAVGDQASRTICVQQHDCISHPLPPDTIMLTTSTCQLLHINAGASLRVTPITLHHVPINIEAQIQQDTGAISSKLAAMLGIKADQRPDLILCPSTYTTTQQNVRLRIAEIREEKPQPTVSQEDIQVVVAQQDQQPNIDASPCIWLKPEVASALGVTSNSTTILLYVAPEATDGKPNVHVMQHPGFCYLSPKDSAALKIEDEAIVEIRNASSLVSYAQLHPPLEGREISFVDDTIANYLQIAQKPIVTFAPVLAKLYWIQKEKVDDIHNKARTEVRLSQKDFSQGGYIRQESVCIFSDKASYQTTIEPTTQSLPEGTLTMTSFLLRQAQLQLDQGVFLSTDHASFLLAKVGILNVDEISSFSVRGSDQLSSLFKMPCLVELRDLQHGTNLDILLEPDPYPRKTSLVRMSRTTRQMLLLERGQQVLVRPIPQTKETRPIRATLLRLLKAPFYQLLLLLIHRRRIHVSISPAHTWDDQAQVARIDAEALAVLGMSEGDRLCIRYRGKSLSRVTLAINSDYKDPISMPEAKDAVYNLLPKQFQIGLDAVGRYKLGGGNLEFGTVVEVERDMGFILLKSLNLSLLPIIGTIVAIITIFSGRPIILQITVAVILACLFFYLALSVERAKVT